MEVIAALLVRVALDCAGAPLIQNGILSLHRELYSSRFVWLPDYISCYHLHSWDLFFIHQVFSKVCTYPAQPQPITRPTRRRTLPPPQPPLSSNLPPTRPPLRPQMPSPPPSTPTPALMQQRHWGSWGAALPVPPLPPLRSSSGTTSVWACRRPPAWLHATSPGPLAMCHPLP